MWKAAALAAFGLAACAQDFTGTWLGQIARPRGEPIEVAFKLVQTGSKVTGKMYGDFQSTPIVEGKVEGGEISFVLIVQEQAGNQINTNRVRFKGTFKGQDLDMTRERESSVDASNGGAVPLGNNTTQQFTLSKLL